jgi:hypothetical protein
MILERVMAGLHIEEYQFPLCRACQTLKKKKATTGFYEEDDSIHRVHLSQYSLKARTDWISYACQEHIEEVKSHLEAILNKFKGSNKKPRWRWLV